MNIIIFLKMKLLVCVVGLAVGKNINVNDIKRKLLSGLNLF